MWAVKSSAGATQIGTLATGPRHFPERALAICTRRGGQPINRAFMGKCYWFEGLQVGALGTVLGDVVQSIRLPSHMTTMKE